MQKKTADQHQQSADEGLTIRSSVTEEPTGETDLVIMSYPKIINNNL